MLFHATLGFTVHLHLHDLDHRTSRTLRYVWWIKQFHTHLSYYSGEWSSFPYKLWVIQWSCIFETVGWRLKSQSPAGASLTKHFHTHHLAKAFSSWLGVQLPEDKWKWFTAVRTVMPITGHTNALNWQRVPSVSWQVFYHTPSLLDCLNADKYPVLKPFWVLGSLNWLIMNWKFLEKKKGNKLERVNTLNYLKKCNS